MQTTEGDHGGQMRMGQISTKTMKTGTRAQAAISAISSPRHGRRKSYGKARAVSPLVIPASDGSEYKVRDNGMGGDMGQGLHVEMNAGSDGGGEEVVYFPPLKHLLFGQFRFQ